MRHFLLLLFIFSTSAWGGGCAQTGPAAEEPEAPCVTDDPPNCPPVTKTVDVRCTLAPDPRQESGEPFELEWELTVEPGPILAGQRFGAGFSGRMVFTRTFLNGAEVVLGELLSLEFKRLAFLRAQATVHVRKGATGPDAILMPEPIPTTCTYDDNGKTGPLAGPAFPACSQTNDNPDGSNDDCIGLAGTPFPENRCLPFVTLETSDDCAPDGVCDGLGETGPGSPCEVNGFCVTEEVSIPLALEGSDKAYTADTSGNVLFGWHDQGIEVREGGPNKGTWILPPPRFLDPLGPNGIRMLLGGVPFAFECAMGVLSRGPDGVDSADLLASPTPDYLLISFPIQ